VSPVRSLVQLPERRVLRTHHPLEGWPRAYAPLPPEPAQRPATTRTVIDSGIRRNQLSDCLPGHERPGRRTVTTGAGQRGRVNGLGQDNFLMVDKITTVRRSNAHAVIGRIEATTLVEFDRRLLVFLGFGT
jgi:hypothetical protein